MQSENKSKFFWVLGLVAVIIIIVFGLKKANSPYQVLTPENYPPGTTVSLYKGIPPGFPKGVILEKNEITHSDVVASTDGKKQMTVSYTSSKAMAEVVKLYKMSLYKDEWKLVVNATSEKVATIIATKEVEKIIITMVPATEGGTTLTFQYEK